MDLDGEDQSSGQNAWELHIVSSATDWICTKTQSPISLPLPFHSSRSTAINSYRVAFFGRGGLPSANKAGQQHYVVPDAP